MTTTTAELTASIFVAAGAFGISVAFIATRSAERKVADLRARGIYPAAGDEKDEDVLRLLRAGEKIMAIRCYRSLHKVGLKEAKDAVELLENQNA
jgi:ribosomal protein L7/L12